MSKIENENQQVANQGSSRNLPIYEEDFGHFAESIIIDAISKELDGVVIEVVEKGTEEDDKIKKIDFWIKFKNVLIPIGIQYSISDNEETIEKKKAYLEKMNYLVPHEKRSDSQIDWQGNATAVLIRGDKLRMGRYFKDRADSTDLPDTPRKEFVSSFFSQLFSELRRIGRMRELEIITGPFLDYQKKLQDKKRPR